jgi:hypothetical protein
MQPEIIPDQNLKLKDLGASHAYTDTIASSTTASKNSSSTNPPFEPMAVLETARVIKNVTTYWQGARARVPVARGIWIGVGGARKIITLGVKPHW